MQEQTYNFQNAANNARNLSLSEQSLENFNKYSGTWTGLFISRATGPVTLSILKQSLKLIQIRHPRLQSRFERENGGLCFKADSKLKIPARVIDSGTTWREVALEEMNTPIDSKRALMRATLVEPAGGEDTWSLITCIHHVIIDGMSGTNLHGELFSYMGKIAEGKPISIDAPLITLPVIESLFPSSVKGAGGLFRKALFLAKYQAKMFWHMPCSLKFEQFAPIEERRSGFIHRVLNESLATKLISVCKQQNTTAQAALSSAMIFAMGNEIGLGKAKRMSLRCSTAIDLRRRFKPIVDNKHLGAFASFFITFHTLRGGMKFWPLARNFKAKLESLLTGNDLFIMISLFNKFVDFILKRPKKGSACAITNLGLIKIPKVYGPLKLESFSIAVSMAALCGVIYAAVTTFNGEMTINFSFSEPSISYETAESIADNVMSCLEQVCAGEDVAFMGKV